MRQINIEDESISDNGIFLVLQNYFICHAILIFGAQTKVNERDF